MNISKRTFFRSLLFIFVFTPFLAQAAGFSVSPLIVDEKAKKRDILKQTIVLTNNREAKLNIYTTVKNIDIVNGEQEFVHRTKTDVTTSLAHWVEITHGVIELGPGETKRISYLIQVHMNAVPDMYHAEIVFQEGSNRAEAEVNKEKAVISVNLEVLDDAKERLQLGSFMPDKTFFSAEAASFSYLLENIGNRSITPKGEIRIFNRRGEEVAELNVNEDGTALLPEATSQLSSVWNASGAFGRYKALLDIEYGDKQHGTVHDTIFFWIIPWKKVIALFLVTAVILVIITSVLYNRFGDGSGQYKFATAYADQRNDSVQGKINSTRSVKATPTVQKHVRTDGILKRLFNRPRVQRSRQRSAITQIQNTKMKQFSGSMKQPLRSSTKANMQKKTIERSSSHLVQLSKRQKDPISSGSVVTLKKRGG